MSAGWAGLLRRAIPRRWHRATRLEELLSRRIGRRVVAGPFSGLAYTERSFGSVYWPKLLGTYELELRALLEDWLARDFRSVLVAGAAEGYYAVGFARRLPDARVVAWEANPQARAAMSELAEMNGVAGRIEIREICDVGELTRALSESNGNPLLMADIEGGEAGLLDPAAIPQLQRAFVLAEVHDCYLPGLTALLRRRFSESHEVRSILPRPRAIADVPEDLRPARKFEGALLQMLSERRPEGNDWMALAPRSRVET